MESLKVITEITKFLDRNFMVAHLTPALILLSVIAAILEQLGLIKDIPIPYNSIEDLLFFGGIVLLLAIVTGVVLLSVNQDIYRLMQGYGEYNPIKIFGWVEKRRYQKILQEVDNLDDEYRACIASKKEFPSGSRTRRNRLMLQLAEEFPDKEEYLLPTPFGNVIRSFEIYPRYMYGLEAIDAWNRLLAVLPREYLEYINTARAQVDFWVNLGAISIVLPIEYIILVFITGRRLQWWVVLLFIGLGMAAFMTASWRATAAAKAWGDFVKSAFDVYRFKLLESLGIAIPQDRKEERKLWTKYSQAIIYRLPEILPELKKTTNKPATRKTKPKKVRDEDR